METLSGVPQPAFELSYNGKPITADIAPYVLSISYSDRLSGESDELDVELEDSDGRWLNAWYPEKGASLELRYGYQGQPLVSAGAFGIDELQLAGPPSIVRIRAMATGVQNAVRTRKGRAYENTTLAAIAQQIAKAHGMKLVGAVEPLHIDRATQYHETDVEFLSRLAKDYGYAFKVTDNNKKLVFWRMGDLNLQAPVKTFRPSDMKSWRFSDKVTGVPARVEVAHHDAKAKKLVVYGVSNGQTTVVGQTNAGKSSSADTVRLTKRAKTQGTAEALSRAEMERREMERTSAEIAIEGDTGMAAGVVIELADLGRMSGRYTVTQASHRTGRGDGYTTALELKRVAPAAASKPAGAVAVKPKGLVVYGVMDGQVAAVGTTAATKKKS